MTAIAKTVLSATLMISSLAISSAPRAQDQSAKGCDAHPYADGISVEDVQGGTKILSTASATVSFDDVDTV